jgi:predicted ArsR family transcriptional regulator
MEERPLADRVAAVSALDEPIRRALFVHVSRSDSPVSKDEAAEALGLARSTAAFHLDRLAEEGLLAVEFKRLTGRTGPGSGRPAKLYRRAAGEVTVTVPDRRYDFAGQLLLAAVEESARTGEPAREALLQIAGDTGRALGSEAGSLEKVLEQHGFEPRPDGEGGLVLGNCPFHRLAQQHTETVCQVNLELLRGAAEGSEDRRHTMVLDPGIGRCCVRAIPRSPSPMSTLARQHLTRLGPPEPARSRIRPGPEGIR